MRAATKTIAGVLTPAQQRRLLYCIRGQTAEAADCVERAFRDDDAGVYAKAAALSTLSSAA